MGRNSSWQGVLGYRAGEGRADVQRRFARLIREVHTDKRGARGDDDRSRQLIAAWKNAQAWFRAGGKHQAAATTTVAPRKAPPRKVPYTPMDWEATPSPSASPPATPFSPPAAPRPAAYPPAPRPAPVHRRGLTAQTLATRRSLAAAAGRALAGGVAKRVATPAPRVLQRQTYDPQTGRVSHPALRKRRGTAT